MAPLPIAGMIPPMVTPMLPSGAPDLESAGRLIDHLAAQGAAGLLILGSCGENGALSRDERLEFAAHAIGHAAGRIHIMVGIPALGNREAVADARAYAGMGADSLLVPPTFVFPHSAAELGDHFRKVAEAGVPVLAYNIPTRVNVVLEADLLKELAAEGVVAGVKDSSGNIEGQRILAEATADIEGFRRYTGSEFAIDGLLLGGFHGAVPGLANVFLPWHVELAARAEAGDWKGAAEMQGRIVKLFKLYQHPMPGGSFSASVVGSLKEGLRQQGVIAHATTAAPFVQVDDGMRAHVRDVLASVEADRP